MADFIKKTWVNGDVITAEELNRMEDGIEAGISSGGGDVVEDYTKAPVILAQADGDTVYANDAADGYPLHGLTMDITPAQEGSGEASPENVRPIYNLADGITVMVSNGQLAKLCETTEKEVLNVDVEYNEGNGSTTISQTGDDAHVTYKFYGLEVGESYTFSTKISSNASGQNLNFNQIGIDGFMEDIKSEDNFKIFDIVSNPTIYSYEFVATERFLYVTAYFGQSSSDSQILIDFINLYKTSIVSGQPNESIGDIHFYPINIQPSSLDATKFITSGKIDLVNKTMKVDTMCKIIDPENDTIAINHAIMINNSCKATKVTIPNSDMSRIFTSPGSYLSNMFVRYVGAENMAPAYSFMEDPYNMSDIYFVMPKEISSDSLAKQWFSNHQTEITYRLISPMTIDIEVPDEMKVDGNFICVYSDFGKNLDIEYAVDTTLAISDLISGVGEFSNLRDNVEQVVTDVEDLIIQSDENSDLINTYLVSENILYSQPTFTIGNAGDTNAKANFFTINGPFQAGDKYTFICDSIENTTSSSIIQATQLSGSIILGISATDNPNNKKLTITVSQQNIDNGLDSIVFSVNASGSTPLSAPCVVTNPMVIKGEDVALEYTEEFNNAVADIVQSVVEPPINNIGDALSLLGDDVQSVKDDLSWMTTADSSDVGKVLTVSKVDGGKVTEWEFSNGGGSDSSTPKAPAILRVLYSGDPAILTDMAPNTSLQNLVINMHPEQEGSGDPSPENPRPISGWTSANIVVSGGKLSRLSPLTERGSSNVSVEYQEETDDQQYEYPETNYFATINAEGPNAYQTYKFYGMEADKRYNITFECNASYNDSCTVSINQVGEDGDALYTFDIDNGTNYYSYNFTSSARFLYMTIFMSDGNVEISNLNLYNISYDYPTSSYLAVRNFPVNWSSEYGTIYSGNLDIINKTLTTYGGFKEIDPDVDTISVKSSISNENGTLVAVGISDMQGAGLNLSNELDFASDKFSRYLIYNSSEAAHAPLYSFFHHWNIASDNQLIFVLPSSVSTSADAKQWFRDNPTEIAYLKSYDDGIVIDIDVNNNIPAEGDITYVFADVGEIFFLRYIANTQSVIFGNRRLLFGSNPVLEGEANEGEYIYEFSGPIESLTISLDFYNQCIYDILFKTSANGASIITTDDSLSWPSGFDPDNLEANKWYEINIMNTYAVVMKWD